MTKENRFGSIIDRIRLSSREIALALALTIAAGTFLVTTLMGKKTGDESAVTVVERQAE